MTLSHRPRCLRPSASWASPAGTSAAGPRNPRLRAGPLTRQAARNVDTPSPPAWPSPRPAPSLLGEAGWSCVAECDSLCYSLAVCEQCSGDLSPGARSSHEIRRAPFAPCHASGLPWSDLGSPELAGPECACGKKWPLRQEVASDCVSETGPGLPRSV